MIKELLAILLKVKFTAEETGYKGDSDKYHDGEGKMDAIWLKVRITTKESGTWTIETGTGRYRNRNFRERL